MARTDRYELSAMDNVLPRYFHGGIWALRLRDGVTQDQVVAMLQTSLDSASVALPFLTRRAFSIPPSPENKSTGRLEAREHVDWTPVVDRNDLTDEWPDYDELMEEGLPQDMLDGSQLLPSDRMRIDLDYAGTPLLVAQANFVEGGLLLGISMFHALMDGMSMTLVFRAWAQHMRLHQGEETQAALERVLSDDGCDYNTLVKLWKEAGEPVAEATPDEWRMLGLLPLRSDAPVEGLRLPGSESEAPPMKPPPPMSTSIFYVSATAISRLSAIAAAANEPGATANDALMALLWRCTIRARRDAAPEMPCYSEPGAMTEMDTTLNGRALLGDKLPWQYMGALVFWATPRLRVDELVSSSTPLESVTGTVRRAVTEVTRERAIKGYGLAATKVPDYTDMTLRRPMPTFDGAEFGITSLLSLPMMENSFGSKIFANGGVPDYFRQERRLFDQVCRYCSIWPLRREGGVEVLVSLTVDEMDYLERDAEFAKFAQVMCH